MSFGKLRRGLHLLMAFLEYKYLVSVDAGGSVGQFVAKSDRNNCRVPNLVDASPLWEGTKVDTLPRSNGNTMLVAVGPTLPQEFFAISV